MYLEACKSHTYQKELKEEGRHNDHQLSQSLYVILELVGLTWRRAS